MVARRPFNGLAWLCGAHQQPDPQTDTERYDQNPIEQPHQAHQGKQRPARNYRAGRQSAASASSTSPGQQKPEGHLTSPFAAGGGRGLSLLEDSDSLSSVPASEAVFGLATRASAPAASLGDLEAGSLAGGPVSTGGSAAGGRNGSILRPMSGGLGSGPAGRSSFRRHLVPNRSLSGRPVPVATPRSLVTSTITGASSGGAGAPIKRAASLSASERSYNSSLLSAAFDRHETRSIITADSASSRSGGSSPAAAPRGFVTSAGSSLVSVRSSASSMSSTLVPAASTSGSPSMASTAAGGGVGGCPVSSGCAATGAAEAAALGAAKGFCEAFLRALATGDARWGSDPRVSTLFGEQARMLTHDGQLFVGRTAIIRRLNAGMEQLHKMLGAMPSGDDGGSIGPMSAQQLADKVHHTLDIQLLSRDAGEGGRKRSILRRLLGLGLSGSGKGGSTAGKAASSDIRRSRSISSPGSMPAGGAAGAGSSIRVVATYNFRFGLRRFKLHDRFAVRDGVIVRLKRTRG